jgi:hypothetical protein
MMWLPTGAPLTLSPKGKALLTASSITVLLLSSIVLLVGKEGAIESLSHMTLQMIEHQHAACD